MVLTWVLMGVGLHAFKRTGDNVFIIKCEVKKIKYGLLSLLNRTLTSTTTPSKLNIPPPIDVLVTSLLPCTSQDRIRGSVWTHDAKPVLATQPALSEVYRAEKISLDLLSFYHSLCS